MRKNLPLKIMNFCSSLVFFAPVATLLRTAKGVTLPQFFLLQALLSVMIFIFEVPTGLLTDRIGYKRGLLIAQALLFAARICFLPANHIGYFILEAILEALSCAFLSGTSTAYLYEVCRQAGEEETFMEQSAAVNAWGTAGFIVSTVLYVFIYHWFSLNALVAATEAATLGAILAAAFLPSIAPSGGCEETGKRRLPRLPRILWQFMLLDAAIGLAGLTVNFLYVEKLSWSGIPVELMTPVILVYSAFDLLIPAVMRKLSALSDAKVYRWFSILAAAALVGIFAVNNYAGVALMMITPFLLNIVNMIQYNHENKYIDQLNQSGNRAALLSMMNMGNSLLEIIFLVLSAVITSGKGNAMFLFAGAVMLALAFCGSRLIRKTAV